MVYPDLIRPNQDFGGRIVRLNIGLEMVDDLISDLDQAFGTMNGNKAIHFEKLNKIYNNIN